MREKAFTFDFQSLFISTKCVQVRVSHRAPVIHHDARKVKISL